MAVVVGGDTREHVFPALLAAVDRVKAEATLVRAESAVELHAESTVDLHLTFVVLPGHAEDYLALRLADALDNFMVTEFRILDQDRSE